MENRQSFTMKYSYHYREPLWLPETKDEDYTNEFGTCRCDKLIPVSRAKMVVHLSGCPIGDENAYREYQSMPWWKKLVHGSPRGLKC